MGHQPNRSLLLEVQRKPELVGANDVMPQILWTRYFLEAQGYKVEGNVLYQDNKSAMLLESNGRGSSSKRTRHINIRYFFITDRIANGELSIEHCPTGVMLSDYFTKPLQGAPFREFRDRIMNVDPGKKVTADPRSVLGNAAILNTCTSGRWDCSDALNGTRAGILEDKIRTGGSNIRDSIGTIQSTVGEEWKVVRRRSIRWNDKVQVHQIK
jgi:hypothetical protein